MKKTVTSATVRMYRMGTGDCFVITFRSGNSITYRMMIDCGACSGSAEKFGKFVNRIKEDVKGEVDALVITHEHDDHVKAFGLCKDLFINGFTAKQVWMAWCENDATKKVKDMKKESGKRMKALALATKALKTELERPGYRESRESQHLGTRQLEAESLFASAVADFRDLHMAVNEGQYAGPLEGMRVVKEDLMVAKKDRKYFKPGDVIEDVPGLDGIRIYVLGPPMELETIKNEHTNKKGESYQRNPKPALNSLGRTDAFAAAVNRLGVGDGGVNSGVPLPFDEKYIASGAINAAYTAPGSEWRTIETDWLMSAGNLALRLNEGINNLSLVLAIEFIESGRVMLFPGDAEYGSWSSWHEVDWSGADHRKETSDKPLVEDLLNRTVFYKVAHHISHNGTADRLGMQMLNHKDLAVMATLDYDVIQSRWKGTMPNWEIVSELIRRSKGRFMVMNTALISHKASGETLDDKINAGKTAMSGKELEDFENALTEHEMWIDYRVNG